MDPLEVPTSSRLRPFQKAVPVFKVPTRVRNVPVLEGAERVASTLKSPSTSSLGPEVLIGVTNEAAAAIVREVGFAVTCETQLQLPA
jgi:hypothetical protein